MLTYNLIAFYLACIMQTSISGSEKTLQYAFLTPKIKGLPMKLLNTGLAR